MLAYACMPEFKSNMAKSGPQKLLDYSRHFGSRSSSLVAEIREKSAWHQALLLDDLRCTKSVARPTGERAAEAHGVGYTSNG